jgi:hypothetical protein
MHGGTTIKINIWVFCRKSVEKIQVSRKSDENNRYFTWRPIPIYDHISLLSMRNVSDRSCRENQNTHFGFNNFFFRTLWHLWDVEKCCTAGQATDDSTIRRMENWGYKHSLKTCNTYSFSTETTVTRTHFNAT